MTTWRSKRMRLEEWGPFQDAFEKLFVGLGGPRTMALFMQGDEIAAEQTIVFTAPNHDIVEGLAKGGWAETQRPNAYGLTLLVGHASALADLGIAQG